MSSRTKQAAGERLYSAEAELEWYELELSKVMLIVGLDPLLIDSVEIDTIVEAITSVFAYDTRKYLEAVSPEPDYSQVLPEPKYDAAHQFVEFPYLAADKINLKSQNQLLMVARRAWRYRHLAKYQAGL